MQTLTYRQAYDKIIEAYFKDEIQPMNPDFCFCGTLSGSNGWAGPRDEQDKSRINYRDKQLPFIPSEHNYSRKEYVEMERAILSELRSCGIFEIGRDAGDWAGHLQQNAPNYEDALFNGMCAALDVLKEIHRSRGENVDEEIPAFTKRELTTQ